MKNGKNTKRRGGKHKRPPMKKQNPAKKNLGLVSARVVRLARTFGFVRRMDDQTDMFVSGRHLMGAMVGDEVLVRPRQQLGEKPEGRVVEITKEAPVQFTGAIVESMEGAKSILPDSIAPFPLEIAKDGLADANPGDKVLAEITSRGTGHAGHRARVLRVYGDADKARVCAMALAESEGVVPEFPPQVFTEARYLSQHGIADEEIAAREDLRDELIFSIDGADSKDLDDAISISADARGYKVGVHIADVSHYVRKDTALDADAFARGTSVYFADRVVPMLPKELSNGICSLNPHEDRLALSVMMTVDKSGELLDYRFAKTAIRTCVRGVYHEVNELLSGQADDTIIKKYAPVRESLSLAQELAQTLTRNKVQRGAPVLAENENKLSLNEDGVCVGVVPRKRGESEIIIEELMILANQAAATLARTENLPFVYRVHEDPSPEKQEVLREALGRLGMSAEGLSGQIRPKHLADILVKSRGLPTEPIINRLVLRTMAKARYSESAIGHFGLVLADYCHFTSPIRRYPDLAIHRIISDYLSGKDRSRLQRKHRLFVQKAAAQSTEREMSAMRLERACVDIYVAEFMSSHVGDEFDGLISGVAEHGIYVEVLGAVEGLLRISALPSGNYSADGGFELVEGVSGKRYRIGDKLKVKCIGTNIAQGQIDFALAEI